MNAGDFLFITFSGHGGQVQDDNRDDPDGQDETWCLYDRQYLDDELWNHFKKFRQGVRIIVISDSCHSGTVVKSPKEEEVAARDKFLTDYFKGGKFRKRNAPNGITFQTYEDNPQAYELAGSLDHVIKDSISASLLQIGACQDSEEAIEFDGHGLLTGTIKKVLSAGHTVASYNELYEKIISIIPPPVQKPSFGRYGTNSCTFSEERLLQLLETKTYMVLDSQVAGIASANRS